MSISALVVAGNYNGMVGYSIGRGMTSEEAYKTAKRRAAKKMMFVPRLFEESLFHDSIGRHRTCAGPAQWTKSSSL